MLVSIFFDLILCEVVCGSSDWHATLVQLSDLPEIDCLLITQSLDDHCHMKTLKPLSEMSPNLKVISTPNAKPLLDPLFKNVSGYSAFSQLDWFLHRYHYWPTTNWSVESSVNVETILNLCIKDDTTR